MIRAAWRPAGLHPVGGDALAAELARRRRQAVERIGFAERDIELAAALNRLRSLTITRR